MAGLKKGAISAIFDAGEVAKALEEEKNVASGENSQSSEEEQQVVSSAEDSSIEEIATEQANVALGDNEENGSSIEDLSQETGNVNPTESVEGNQENISTTSSEDSPSTEDKSKTPTNEEEGAGVTKNVNKRKPKGSKKDSKQPSKKSSENKSAQSSENKDNPPSEDELIELPENDILGWKNKNIKWNDEKSARLDSDIHKLVRGYLALNEGSLNQVVNKALYYYFEHEEKAFLEYFKVQLKKR